jgi:hypothetical protein
MPRILAPVQHESLRECFNIDQTEQTKLVVKDAKEET